MKKSVCFTILLLLLVTIFDKTSNVFAKDLNDNAYEYPVTVYSPSWKELNSVEDRRSSCVVPLETLNSMSTRALIETIVHYPLFADVYAYDSLLHGFYALNNYFKGVEVLKNRKDALKCINEYYYENRNKNNELDIYIINIKTLYKYIHRIKMNNSYLSFMDKVSNRALLSEDPDFYDENYHTIDWNVGNAIYTPQGTEIPLLWLDPYYYYVQNGDPIRQNRFYELSYTYFDDNPTQQEQIVIANYYLNAYPSTVLVASVSPKYNCHSYAWYSQLTSNKYWISDPSVYIHDGSYSATTTAAIGNKVIYVNTSLADCIEHSGIIASLQSGNTPVRVTSKWGYNALFTHDINDCPYVGNNINIYMFN